MHLARIAIAALTAAFAIVTSSGPAGASEKTDVMTTVRQFANALNAGNIKSAVATCAGEASIVDEFPPHEWQGSTACADWAHDFTATNKSQGITAGVVTIGAPWHVDVDAGTAYVVAPASYRYMQHGKRVTESGSVFTVTLKKLAAGWRITGWAWAAH